MSLLLLLLLLRCAVLACRVYLGYGCMVKQAREGGRYMVSNTVLAAGTGPVLRVGEARAAEVMMYVRRSVHIHIRTEVCQGDACNCIVRTTWDGIYCPGRA